MKGKRYKNGSTYFDFNDLKGIVDQDTSFEISLFKSFMNASPNLCWVIDGETNLLYANQSFLNYFKIRESQIPQKLLQLLPADIASVLQDKFQMKWNSQKSWEDELKTTRVDGTETVFSIESFRLSSLHGRHIYGGIATNKTDSYLTEQKLLECNQRWLAFAHNAFHGIWEYEVKDNHFHVNDALKSMLQFDKDASVTVKNYIGRIHPEQRKQMIALLQESLDKELKWEHEYEIWVPESEYKTVLNRGFMVKSNGSPYKLIGSVLDISEMKDLETKTNQDAKKKDMEWSQTLLQVQERERTFIGHELHDNVCQILASAKLFLDLLLPADRNQVEIKQKTNDLIMKSLEEIRGLSKDLSMPVLKEDGLIKAIEDLIEDLRITTSLSIEFKTDGQEIEQLDNCKKVTLFRIVQEQFKNVIKHARATNVIVRTKSAHGLIELSIQDDGVGFDTKAVRRGVGLSSIFERTKICDGNMKLESKRGKGTKLMVVFPIGS